MSLANRSAAGWLQSHKTSPAEIRDLWLVGGRDLADAASSGISADWQPDRGSPRVSSLLETMRTV